MVARVQAIHSRGAGTIGNVSYCKMIELCRQWVRLQTFPRYFDNNGGLYVIHPYEDEDFWKNEGYMGPRSVYKLTEDEIVQALFSEEWE
jgi:hypothetical protein